MSNEWDNTIPPKNGDLQELRFPRQSWGSAFRMWLGYSFRSWVMYFIALMVLALLIYGLAFVILYIRFAN